MKEMSMRIPVAMLALLKATLPRSDLQLGSLSCPRTQEIQENQTL